VVQWAWWMHRAPASSSGSEQRRQPTLTGPEISNARHLQDCDHAQFRANNHRRLRNCRLRNRGSARITHPSARSSPRGREEPPTMRPTQALSVGRYRHLKLTTKDVGRGFYKGNRTGSMGRHTKYGGYVIEWNKVRTYAVPDLKEFKVWTLFP